LIAKILGEQKGGPSAELAIGFKGEKTGKTQEELENLAIEFGNDIKDCDADEIVHDAENKIVSVPCKLSLEYTPIEVYNAMKAMVDEVM